MAEQGDSAEYRHFLQVTIASFLFCKFTPTWRIQCFGSVFILSGSGSRGWGWIPIRIRIQSGSRALMTKNWKKITAEKKIKFFCSKTAIYLSLGLHKVCPSCRRSLQLSKEAIQHFKTWTFTNFFLLLWVIFALLDPDPKPCWRLTWRRVEPKMPFLYATRNKVFILRGWDLAERL